VSNWKLELPKVLRSFDYGAIVDVVLELQYTAREGGGAFASQVLGENGADLRSRLDSMSLGSEDYGDGRMWGWSVRSRFPEAWAAFRQPAAEQPHRAELELGTEHYPRPLSGSDLRVSQAYVVLTSSGVPSNTSVTVTPPGGSMQTAPLLAGSDLPGVLVAGPFTVSTPPSPTAHAFGTWAVELASGDVPPSATLHDLALVMRYTEGA
jgi:hypothetical protein